MPFASVGAFAARHRLASTLLGIVATCAVVLPACEMGPSIPEIDIVYTIVVTSTPATGPVPVGSTRQYAVDARNQSDNSPAPQFADATWSIVGSSSIATISASGLATCTGVGTVLVQAVGVTDPSLAATAALECIPMPAPDLSISKAGTVSGQTVTYTLTVTNAGSTSSPGPITVVDSLPTSPAGLTWSGVPSGCTASGPVVCTSSTPLAAGAQLTFSFTLVLPPTGGAVTNCASVSQATSATVAAETELANNRACATHTVPHAPIGSIRIIKDASPDHPQDFFFSTTGAGLSDFSLDDDPSDGTLSNSKAFTNLPIDVPYTITEASLAGWALTSVVCSQSGATGAPASITYPSMGVAVILTTGANVVCTFNNKSAPAPSSITIVKDAVPNSAQDFTFTSNQASIPAFLLDDDDDATLSSQKVFTTLPAGSYAFTEAVTSGWNLTGIACTPSANSTVDVASRTATINLAAGVNVVCTFTNTQVAAPTTGSITIVKDADPNSTQDFTFTSNQASIPAFLLDDDDDGTLSNQKAFQALPPGSYSFTEAAAAGWNLTGIACTPSAGSTTDVAARTATINLTAGANVVCTFTNTVIPAPTTGSITIVKDAVPNSAQDFTFTSNQASIPAFLLDDDSDATLQNHKAFSALPPGSYAFTEAAASGWDLAGISCTPSAGTTTDVAARTATVALTAGADVVCTFINTETPAPSGPDLSITKVGVLTSSAMGRVMTYTITVTNIGTADAPGPIITRDSLPSSPAGLMFTSFSSGCSGPTSGPIVCSSATPLNPSAPLAPSAQLTYTITMAVPAGSGTVVNCASVTQGGSASTPPEANLDNNRACTSQALPSPAPTPRGPDEGPDRSFVRSPRVPAGAGPR